MPVREARDDEALTPQDHVFKPFGPGCEHNVLCSVCHESGAIWYMNSGILEPCWECQKQGYRTIKTTRFVRWWLGV